MTTYTITDVPVSVEETGSADGRPFLLLHGGAGPVSFRSFAAYLAARRPARVLVPVHPGFDGTPRPETLHDVRGLAALYVALIDELGLDGVTVVGNSIGGWIAAEMALLAGPRIAGVIVVNGVGIEVPDHPVADFFALSMDELAEKSYFEPDRFRMDPSAFDDATKARMAGNRSAIALYAGTAMTDPTLIDRLKSAAVPVLVLWGQSDRIVDPDYGRAYADAIPGATYLPVEHSGHLPQLETPDRVLEPIWSFTA
jgi:pimeloyl-ACP methyl ester carboxylesterase